MFKNQINELKDILSTKEELATLTEEELKKIKEEIRDLKQAVTSLERMQSKYDPTSLTEVAYDKEECDK